MVRETTRLNSRRLIEHSPQRRSPYRRYRRLSWILARDTARVRDNRAISGRLFLDVQARDRQSRNANNVTYPSHSPACVRSIRSIRTTRVPRGDDGVKNYERGSRWGEVEWRHSCVLSSESSRLPGATRRESVYDESRSTRAPCSLHFGRARSIPLSLYLSLSPSRPLASSLVDARSLLRERPRARTRTGSRWKANAIHRRCSRRFALSARGRRAESERDGPEAETIGFARARIQRANRAMK